MSDCDSHSLKSLIFITVQVREFFSPKNQRNKKALRRSSNADTFCFRNEISTVSALPPESKRDYYNIFPPLFSRNFFQKKFFQRKKFSSTKIIFYKSKIFLSKVFSIPDFIMYIGCLSGEICWDCGTALHRGYFI